MISPSQLIKELGRSPLKGLGQHFLIHEHTVERIIKFAGFDTSDVVVEVGPGVGALTAPLAQRVKKLYAVEVDKELVSILKRRVLLPQRQDVHLINQDILSFDFVRLASIIERPVKVIGNLPYNISSPFLFMLLDSSSSIDSAVLMLQAEVAQRLLASPGSKDYGILTVLFSHKAHIKKGFFVKPQEFYPQPKVGSMVISIDFKIKRGRPALEPSEEKLFRQIVKAAFGKRRKMLRNSLLAISPGLKRHLAGALEACGIPETARAEELPPDKFLKLTKYINTLEVQND